MLSVKIVYAWLYNLDFFPCQCNLDIYEDFNHSKTFYNVKYHSVVFFSLMNRTLDYFYCFYKQRWKEEPWICEQGLHKLIFKLINIRNLVQEEHAQLYGFWKSSAQSSFHICICLFLGLMSYCIFLVVFPIKFYCSLHF